MKNLLGSIVCLLLLAISLLHFYWALGGRKWADVVLPKTAGSNQVAFKAGHWATVIAALVFGMFAIAIAAKTFFPISRIPDSWTNVTVWVIAGAFLLRAVGDFKYVGFGKKIHSTNFAAYDTKIYTPLSLFIGLMTVTIALL